MTNTKRRPKIRTPQFAAPTGYVPAKQEEVLTSAEIGERNRRIMFGDNYEAFPSQEEWSRIVD